MSAPEINVLWPNLDAAADLAIGCGLVGTGCGLAATGTGLLLKNPAVREFCGGVLDRPGIREAVGAASSRAGDRIFESLRRASTPAA